MFVCVLNVFLCVSVEVPVDEDEVYIDGTHVGNAPALWSLLRAAMMQRRAVRMGQDKAPVFPSVSIFTVVTPYYVMLYV